jgi:site-specific DNA-methyltransferase (adenine-specific)
VSEYTLHLGDCLDFMRGMDTGGVDAVITDPPWNMSFFRDDSKTWKEYSEWLDVVKKECERVSRLGVWIFQSTKAVSFTAHLFDGYMPFAAVKNFSQMTPSSLPNCWDIAFYKVNGGYLGNGRNWYLCNTAGMLNDRTEHPTPRTLDVMTYIIQMFSWRTIFDPFMGSGTTGVACMQLGRRFIGCEIDAGYFAIAQNRISEAAAQPALFHLDAPKIEHTQAAFA